MMRRESDAIGQRLRWFVILIFAIAAVGVVGTDNLPDPQPRGCSCAGKGPGCVEREFDLPDGRVSQCAIWGERRNCCARPAP